MTSSISIGKVDRISGAGNGMLKIGSREFNMGPIPNEWVGIPLVALLEGDQAISLGPRVRPEQHLSMSGSHLPFSRDSVRTKLEKTIVDPAPLPGSTFVMRVNEIDDNMAFSLQDGIPIFLPETAAAEGDLLRVEVESVHYFGIEVCLATPLAMTGLAEEDTIFLELELPSNSSQTTIVLDGTPIQLLHPSIPLSGRIPVEIVSIKEDFISARLSYDDYEDIPENIETGGTALERHSSGSSVINRSEEVNDLLNEPNQNIKSISPAEEENDTHTKGNTLSRKEAENINPRSKSKCQTERVPDSSKVSATGEQTTNEQNQTKTGSPRFSMGSTETEASEQEPSKEANKDVSSEVVDNEPVSSSKTEIQQLRREAEKAASENPADEASTGGQSQSYQRAQAIKEYARARANGKCEACEQPAPFVTPRGEPYLETHHVDELSQGGEDHPSKVVAICPTCHSEIHYGEDGQELNRLLRKRLLNGLADVGT